MKKITYKNVKKIFIAMVVIGLAVAFGLWGISVLIDSYPASFILLVLAFPLYALVVVVALILMWFFGRCPHCNSLLPRSNSLKPPKLCSDCGKEL